MSNGSRRWSVEAVRARLGLDFRTVIDMVRGPIPPTIGLAIYQSNYFAGTFSTFGYLVSVAAILSNCLLPRVLFIKTVIATLGLLLLGCCVTLLAGYCTVTARHNTTARGSSSTAYNSSAATVTAIWLISVIWLLNTIRAYRPALNVSIIIASIYIEVTIITHIQRPTVSAVIDFDLKLLEAMVIGCCLAIGVNLFIFPMTSRQVYFDDVGQHLVALKTTLEAESAYVASFERSDVLKASTYENLEASEPKALSRKPEAVSLENAMNSLTTIHTKTRTDLSTAKKDVGWSSFTPHDLHDLFRFIRRILVVLRGLTTLMSLYETLIERRGWATTTDEDGVRVPDEHYNEKISPEEDAHERKEWGLIFRDYRAPVERLQVFTAAALQHVDVCLGAKQSSPVSLPAELLHGLPGPIPPVGGPDFTIYFKAQVSDWHQRRSRILNNWQQRRSSRQECSTTEELRVPKLSKHDQEQLFVILYLQHLFHGLLDSVQDLLVFAEEHDTRKHPKHLILPGRRKVVKMIRGLLRPDEHDMHPADADEAHMPPLYTIPTRLAGPVDGHPEYLRPKNAFQKFGNKLRKLSSFLSSSQSLFGLRVACAVMSVAIVAMLADTNAFFFRQRLLWATILIAFSMNSTSGASFSTFIYRIMGSVTATVLSMANWYIVDGHPAGVLVMFWLFNAVITYFSIKYPKYAAVWRIHMITTTIMIGYALQTRKTGIAAPPATSSEHYPMYLIAPYRLATTFAGVFVAFVWTIFPAPVTARSVLRRRLGDALYVLATYYSAVHTTMALFLEDNQGDLSEADSPGRVLEKVRGKLFVRELAALASLREHSALSRFEPTIGGDFPHALYDQIITEVDALLSHVNLIAHAAMTLRRGAPEPRPESSSTSDNDTIINSQSQWKHNLAHRFRTATSTSHSVTTLLSLIASCIMNGQPLPPFLEAPKPYHLAHQLQELDPDLLSTNMAVKHPEYSAFAVTEVSATMMSESLRRLLVSVTGVVGEVDFEGDWSGRRGQEEKAVKQS